LGRDDPPVPVRPAVTAAAVSAALLAAVTFSAPAAVARPAEPGPTVPIPGRSARPPSIRPVAGPPAVPAGDLGSLRSRATRLRAKLDGQHRRLEVLAENLEEAYTRGVGLLAEASLLDRRRQAAEREVAAAQAELDERARSSYMAGPGWFVANLVGADDPADALARLPLQRAVLDADLALVDRVARAKERLDHTRSRLSERLVDQARGAEQLDTKRAEAERLAAEIQRELRTMDRRVTALVERERRREEATQQAAFAGYLAAARTAGTTPPRDGRASPAAAKAVQAALAQLGSPYVWGAEGPSTFDCSGLTSFADAAAGITIPRVSRSQFAAYAGLRPVDPMHLIPGDLVFFADNPRNPPPSTTSASTSAAARWSRPPTPAPSSAPPRSGAPATPVPSAQPPDERRRYTRASGRPLAARGPGAGRHRGHPPPGYAPLRPL
jgi:cell wall-associated NlpC family hydrolase